MEFSVQGTIKNNYNLSHLTWFKVGGPAEIFFKPRDQEDLVSLLKQNAKALDRKSVTIIGACSNIMIRDGGVDGIVIKLTRNFTDIVLKDSGTLEVGAGCLNYNLAKFAAANSIKGLEFLVGIPGTIGGGVAMNAGAYSREFVDIVLSAEAVDLNGDVKILTNKEIGFKHRSNSLPKDLIFTKVIIKAEQGNELEISKLMEEINARRNATQPIKEMTGGSTFVNPEGAKAWELIDKAGCRGHEIGGAQMSTLHCNFMINKGNATATDLETLGEYVRNEVLQKTGIVLEWEIKRIGKND